MNGMHPGMAQQGMEGDYPQIVGGTPDNKHALQDYQMQLMLLEQQNKKRLLAAKRDNPETMAAGALGGSGPPGGFQQAPNMSPSGSRGAGGPSPTPNDQMRKVAGTPKLGQQGPGSPMADIQNRASPAPNFDPGNPQLPPGMPQQFYGINGNQMGRPQTSHPPNFPMNMNPQQIAQMREHAVRTGQAWPPPQMMQNMVGQQNALALANAQRLGVMAPPPVPAEPIQPPQQRAQPSSPPPAPAPPTPSTKAAAKPKKEPAKKKAQNKKNATAATPAAEELPPTSTPSTPHASAQLAKANVAQAAVAPPAQPALDAGAGNIFAGMDDGNHNNVRVTLCVPCMQTNHLDYTWRRLQPGIPRHQRQRVV
jgi:hypothetical protein